MTLPDSSAPSVANLPVAMAARAKNAANTSPDRKKIFTPALNLSQRIDKELNALRWDVQRHYDFDGAAFADHLRAFRAKL